MANERKSTSKRLSKEAQEIVYIRLIAGATNAEVRQALHDAGHPSDLDHGTFYHYRKTKRVRDGIALLAHEEFQTGLGLPSRRIAYCKYFLDYCIQQVREGVMVEVEVPAETNAQGEIITPASKRWERQDLRPIDLQRYASVGANFIMQIGKLIDAPNGIYKGAILPAELAEQAAAEATKDKTGKGPLAHLTKTQALAYFNDMLEATLKEAEELGLMEKTEPLSATLLVPPSPDREIPAGDFDEDDFGDDD